MCSVLKHFTSSQPVFLKILPCFSGFLKWPFFKKFPHQYSAFFYPHYVPDLSYLHCLHWPVNIRWTVSIMKFHTAVGCHAVLTGEHLLMCWRHCDPLKHSYICTSCHNVTSWKTWISSDYTWHSENPVSFSLCNTFNFKLAYSFLVLV